MFSCRMVIKTEAHTQKYVRIELIAMRSGYRKSSFVNRNAASLEINNGPDFHRSSVSFHIGPYAITLFRLPIYRLFFGYLFHFIHRVDKDTAIGRFYFQ